MHNKKVETKKTNNKEQQRNNRFSHKNLNIISRSL